MTGPKAWLALALGLGLACGDDTDPAPEKGGDGSSGGAAEDTTGGASSSSGAMTFTASFTGADSSTGGDPDTGAPQAEVITPSGSRVDFGPVEVGDARVLTIELLNVGGAVATDIEPTGFDGPFGFTDGSFPGALGNCSETLAAGELCTLHVQFNAEDYGPTTGEMRLSYAGGASSDIVVVLTGEGIGETANLLEDGGFEDCRPGGAAADWDESAGTWTCEESVGRVLPATGERLLAGASDGRRSALIERTISLEPYARAVSVGDGVARLSATLRSEGSGPEASATFLDAAGRGIGVILPDYEGPGWEVLGEELEVPVAAVSVRVALRCAFGGADCYFDDVSFTLDF